MRRAAHGKTVSVLVLATLGFVLVPHVDFYPATAGSPAQGFPFSFCVTASPEQTGGGTLPGGSADHCPGCSAFHAMVHVAAAVPAAFYIVVARVGASAPSALPGGEGFVFHPPRAA